MSWLEAALRWYAVLAALSWALAPGVRWLCVRLADNGASVVRPLAMLAAVYPAWLLSSLGFTPFGSVVVLVAAVLAAGIGWTVSIRTGDLAHWLRRLLAVEVGSALVFAGYVWLRGYTPQILGTEKPMDVAFLASSMRTVVMPPPDPWFAGEPINYYYLGYLLHGTIGRLASVPPEVAFNLALATVFSTTLVAAFGVAWNVVAPRFGRVLAYACGAFAVFSLAIAGNLYAPIRLIQDAPATVAAWWWDGGAGIGWRSSRIVCDGPRVGNRCQFPSTETINEFPFFSMLLGDLHPHLMALPYSLVAIGLAWNLWTMGPDVEMSPTGRWVRLGLSGAAAGALYPLNAWDFPTYLVLMLAGVWAAYGPRPKIVAARATALIAAALLPWFPFLLRYAPPTMHVDAGFAPFPGISGALSAVSLHLGERTSLREYLTIFGVPYVFGVALVLFVWNDDAHPMVAPRPEQLAGVAAATIVPGIVLSAPVIPLCGIPLALALSCLKRGGLRSPHAFALVLLGFAWALSIGVEIVYVRDAFDDRMNTLFKFYFQAWTLYSIAAAISFAALWRAARLTWQRTALAAAAAASILAGAAYPIVGSYQWTGGFDAWRGLDGLAYGEATSADDVAAVRWLGGHAEPGDVVLEAAGCSYGPRSFGLPFNRVSAFTGVPTVIGWANHERQWRAGQRSHIAAIPARQADVASVYADPSGTSADAYGINWLFVGDHEVGDWQAECETAGPYDGIASAAFPGPDWEEAFRSGQTRIYRRIAP